MLIYKEKLLVSVNSTAHCGDPFVIEYLGEIETEFVYFRLFIRGPES